MHGDIMENKKILIVFTGGTISMSSDLQTSKFVISSNESDLIQKIRKRFQNIELITMVYSMKPSPSITSVDMLEIGKLIQTKIDNEEIDGCVITHGTDTLEETAFFLDVFLSTSIPIVLTGSMRNFSELGYDGFSNLLSAILVSASPYSYGRGTLVVLNDEINAAVEVTKTHTVSLGTFKSMEFGPLGIVDEQEVIYYRDSSYHRQNLSPELLTSEVEIVKVYSGSSGHLIDYLISQPTIKGIVLEAMGRGNIPPAMVPSVLRAINKGIKVVLTSRCPMGRVRDSYGYEGGGHHLKQVGVLFAGDLLSVKARIKLMLAVNCATVNVEDYFEH